MSKYVKIATIPLMVLILSACSGNHAPAPEDIEPDEGGISLTKLFSGELFGAGQSEVNSYVWRAALETLSDYPLQSTDPFTGLISTDWFTSGTQDEQLRVTVRIRDKVMTVESVEVSVYRQVLDGQAWRNAQVNAQLPARLQDVILTRARQLRVADLNAQ